MEFRSGDASLATRPGVPRLFTPGEPFVGARTFADWLSPHLPRGDFPGLSAGPSALGPAATDAPGGALLAD